MKFLLTRAKSFHLPGGRRGAPESIVTLAPGEVNAPDWVRETNTYRNGVADGSIRDFVQAGPTAFFVPTREQLVEKGYAPEVADEIIARQRELTMQFAPPAKEEKLPVYDSAPEPFLPPAIDPASLGFGGGTPEPALSKAEMKKAATKAAAQQSTSK